jgi:hypothetical protein
MDINNSLQKLVEDLTADILNKVQTQVEQAITSAVSQRIHELDIQSQVSASITSGIDLAIKKHQPNLSDIQEKINRASDAIITTIVKDSEQRINSLSTLKLQELDFNQLTEHSIRKLVNDKINSFDFPNRSIPVTSINFSNSVISGDYISGGIIKNFGSTGIDDKATGCQITILDNTTVIENNLVTMDLTVKGTTTVDGDLIVNGDVPTSSKFFINLVEHAKTHVKHDLNENFFKQYRDQVFEKIKSDGVELSKISLNGKEVIINNKLGSTIVESNLQKVGVLKELQVNGETLLNSTAYITNKRVGINTLEPSSVLSVWDEEVEIAVGKRKLNTAFIGTPRNQNLVITSNGKDNLVANPDGSVSVETINIGRMNFGSSPVAPNYESPKGTVVFNENPTLGGPLGWVSLGGARWANFGIID